MASIEFRRSGIETTGVADVMQAAGLTNGGFYRHFGSKDELVYEALDHAFDLLFSAIHGRVLQKRNVDALEVLVSNYLSRQRRDEYDIACPLAALASELPRTDQETKKIASDAVDRFILLIQDLLTELPRGKARARATGILATMVGGMVLSRVSQHPSTANRILKDSRDFALQTL